MKKNVLLNVKGLRRSEDFDEDCVDFTTEAVFSTTDKGYAVEYEESEITGQAGTKTRVEFCENGVSIQRTGTTESQLVFERGRRHVTLYRTEIGDMEVAVCSDCVDVNLSENGGVAGFNYAVEINGYESSYNEFEMKIWEGNRL